jgi:hypothetical protein
MGNLLNRGIAADSYSLRTDQLQPINAIQSSIGTLRILQNPKTDMLYIEKNVAFDSDESLEALKRSLEDLRKANGVGYLEVQAAEIHDRRMFCSPSYAKLVVDYFEKTLEDVIRMKKVQDFFYTEGKVWKFLFRMVDLMNFNQANKIESHFIHPRTIFYDKAREKWGLIHHGFFQESNYTEALAGNIHFCSPELFFQILSQNKKFLIVDSDRSNMFSLGLVALYLIYSLEEGLDFDKIYNRSTVSVDGFQIHLYVEDLASRRFSGLLVRVLEDMLQEYEHKRLSSSKFSELLDKHRMSLETDNFKGYDIVFDEYCNVKGSNDNLSINNKMTYAFGNDRRDNLNISENFLNDETMNNLKSKTVPFNARFMEEENSF